MRRISKILMGKLRIESSAFVAIILFASLGMAADQSAGGRTFKAELSGNEEVPPIKTDAAGTATFQTSEGGNTMTYTLTLSHIKGITGALLCKGKRGENGAIVTDLFKERAKVDVSGTFFAEGKIEAYLLFGPLQGGSVPSLIHLMETGEVYINILTKKHPGGEIRGQVK
jgi:hypothetical protein